jgi:hypothetical protein
MKHLETRSRRVNKSFIIFLPNSALQCNCDWKKGFGTVFSERPACEERLQDALSLFYICGCKIKSGEQYCSCYLLKQDMAKSQYDFKVVNLANSRGSFMKYKLIKHIEVYTFQSQVGFHPKQLSHSIGV